MLPPCLLTIHHHCRLLIFYTYAPDTQQAEVNQRQDSIISLEMPEMDARFKKPDISGRGIRADAAKIPVQMYCRARPWFQILVYDEVTGEEVGASLDLPFQIYRLDRSRSFAYRVEKLREAMKAHAAGIYGDPYDLPEGRADPEVAAYLQRQQKRGKLADLWAKAEVSSLEQSSPDDLKASINTALNTALPEEEMVKDDEVYLFYAQGTLGQVRGLAP